MQLTDVGLFSHLLGGIGFAALAVSTLMRKRRDEATWWLIGAAVMTALWAFDFVMAARIGAPFTYLLSPLETLRTASWVAFIIALLRISWRLDDRLSSSFFVAGVIGFVTTAQLTLDAVGWMNGEAGSHEALLSLLFVVSRLTVAISGLVLLHNLYVNASPGSRGGIRLLCIGLAGFFGYDLNLYTLQFLLGSLSGDLFNIRGAVDAIVVPLLLSGTSTWVTRVQLSRQVVFHTLSFSIIGGYLIVMALTAYGLRLVGGDWGRLLQISFLFGTAIIGVVVLVAPRFRAALRVKIAKNFFAYKYDYRQEWLRFIATVSYTARGSAQLSERVIQAVCEVVDAPGGVLFAPDDEGGFVAVSRWNFRSFAGESVDAAAGFAPFLSERQRVIDFDEWRAGSADYAGMVLPEWTSDRRSWLAIPLLHLDALAGFILLQRTVAPRDLNWEDYDLLRTLGRQAAGYIAEASVQTALDEAGAFDAFNRRFAFIMHDIKNLVSQLSLVTRNAERHADNPAFRADMLATLHSSVGKMNDLLARLAQHNTARSETPEAVDVGELIDQVVRAKRHAHTPLYRHVALVPCFVEADPGRLEQLFAHLIQNAIDASNAEAQIDVTTTREAESVIVAIADHGCGMAASFVRSELFKPFASTKVGGFGIGAYEAREIARSLGGRLDVVSREGEGTVFTVTLPALNMVLSERMSA